MRYLEVQVEDVHLVHVFYALADLLDEQDGVELRQAAVLINDAVEQLPAFHTTEGRGTHSGPTPRPVQAFL